MNFLCCLATSTRKTGLTNDLHFSYKYIFAELSYGVMYYQIIPYFSSSYTSYIEGVGQLAILCFRDYGILLSIKTIIIRIYIFFISLSIEVGLNANIQNTPLTVRL